MALPKPTSKLDWKEGTPNFGDVTIEPSSGKKLAGWASNERPPFQFMNWLFWIVHEWVNYFESVIDEGVSGAGLVYKAYVGGVSGTSHATLADALADVAVTAGDRIFVVSSESINSTIQITKNNIEIHFKSGVTFSKGSASTGLQISADGVKIVGGRFTGFNGGGDEAILIDAGSDYTMLRDMRFANNTTDVDDLASTSSLSGNITE
jgi:hypothetical protein